MLSLHILQPKQSKLQHQYTSLLTMKRARTKNKVLSPHKWIRAASHMRLRAHDRYTSSTLIGGKGGAGPSLYHEGN